MALFRRLKTKEPAKANEQVKQTVSNSPNSYVNASTVSSDEQPFYQPDSYYTFYSYPGTPMAVKVTTFEERKKTSYPSTRGLYVAEIMLLDYCSTGKYPKPSSGYPGFWWFKYGIRDVGHALESLEKRGFLQWASKTESLNGLKADDLKRLLSDADLPTTGKKADLIDRIKSEIQEDKLIIPNYVPKYELTALGKAELEENGYVPYMHRHSHLTTENGAFGETFTVWDINKLFPDGNALNWRQVVGSIEKERYGVDMANVVPEDRKEPKSEKSESSSQRDEMRRYMAEKQAEIELGIKSRGDGFEEESQGLEYKAVGKDKETLVKLILPLEKNLMHQQYTGKQLFFCGSIKCMKKNYM